ncbi:MAG TPA: tetratricopeptide repeat protein [Gaiellaceae bacterium]|nr:tetratricopeptide repeat protein [Gaiellaceae bacterium]
MGRRRLAGPAAGAAALAATAGLAFAGGGYDALAQDRALVLLAAAALALLLLAPVERPGRPVLALVAALAALTAWTAASWLWSDSPPAALEEAQRVAAYLAAALAVAAAGRRLPLAWLAGGVAAGAAAAATWNLLLRLAPDWTGRGAVRTDIGQLADPVGYGNGLALLAAVGLLLLLALAVASRATAVRAPAALLLVPLAADLAVLQSDGALAALGAALLVFLVATPAPGRGRALALLALPLVGAVAVWRESVVVSPPPSNLLAAAAPGHRLFAGLALLAAVQAALAVLLRRRPLRIRGRAAAVAAVVALAAGVAAAPFALGGHERAAYWRVAGREAAANPVLGGGAGTYADWWTRERDALLATREAHSLYLETLAELGPLGLALLAAALAAPLAAAIRARGTPLGPGVLAALVAYDLHAAVDFDWELAGVTLPVVVLGAAAAVHAAPRRQPLAGRSRTAVSLAAAAFVAAGILALAGTGPLAAAADASLAGRYPAAIDDARRALRFAPWSAEAWRTIGRARLAEGDRRAARAAFLEATRLDPADWQTWAELASASTGGQRRAALGEAARRNPLWAAEGASG